ncbi:hypothetical protein MKW94_020283 [Papaver nudicaule]|uniref:Uncharacterized protein n=1 Tax=Papaver nudicaule TaxID=74823 RepID=A0AA41VVH6_PAPNU|nr:hypothetical protein [Papaver nudicaule]
MLQMAGGNSTGSRTTSSCLRESSPPLNWSPLSPRSYPSDGQDDRIQLDVTALINESHRALNSLDSEIDSNPENDNIIDNNHENANDERLPVSFNELGQWNGPAQFSTLIGEVTRAKIPLKYHNWTKVPPCYKEEVWDAIQSTYQVTEINKEYVLLKSNSAWRTEKCKQRRKVMDAKTVQEKKRRVPTYYNKDDWEAFIDYNTSDKFKEKSKKASEARAQVQAQYTGGRKGIPRTWLQMEQESPTGEVYRPHVYLATHNFVADDNPLSSKSIAAAKVAKVKEAYDKEPSAQNCLATDAVTRVSGIWC